MSLVDGDRQLEKKRKSCSARQWQCCASSAAESVAGDVIESCKRRGRSVSQVAAASSGVTTMAETGGGEAAEVSGAAASA